MLSAHPIAWAGQPKALPGPPMARGWPTLGVVSGISYWRSWGTLWALECDASLSAPEESGSLECGSLECCSLKSGPLECGPLSVAHLCASTPDELEGGS